MATITLTNATKNNMADEFISGLNNRHTFGAGSSPLGGVSGGQFDNLITFNITNPFASGDFIGRTKVGFERPAGTNGVVRLKNILGNGENPPLIVTYHKNYFRDIIFAQSADEIAGTVDILMTYQVLPSEVQINAKNKYGVTYVQEFEVTFA